ncbi:hypothetical protein GCM10008015_30320 [Flavobacterium palustre]|uniref:rhamnogalacturonan endolyase n=2 Tax=Flavobacterium palustre TaxID=1476463 RepID=A0ABQ1HTM2_9FLAO|nr:hypothetical protein GCM10008015_30320 [Flavobacterium palustre]
MTAFTVLTFLTVQTSFAQKWNVIAQDNDISSVNSCYTSIAVLGNVPYVAYVEATYSAGATGPGKVKMKNPSTGVWEQVGTTLSALTGFPRLYKDKIGDLYVTYIDRNNSYKLAVKKLVSGAWVPLSIGNDFVSTAAGTATFAASDARGDLAFDNNNVPYIAYSERVGTTSGNAYVKRFVNGAWETVGGAAVSADTFAAGNGIAFDSNNIPYAVYIQQSASNSGTGAIKVFRLTNNIWEDISPVSPVAPGTTTTGATTSVRHTSIAIDDTNSPVVTYFNTTSAKGTAIRLTDKVAKTWTWLGDISTRDANRNMLINDSAGNLYTIFQDALIGSGTSATVRVFKKASGTSTFTEVQNYPITSESGVGIDAAGPNVTTAATKSIVNATIALGSDASKPYIVYAKTNGSGVVTPVVRLFDPGDPTDVKVIDNTSTVVMDNGIVKVTISKTSGTVTSLIYNGLEMVQGGYGGGSIYWSWNMPNYQNPSGCTYSLITDPSANNFDSAEIKMHMTWDGTANSAAMDVDIYYSLQRNVSGLYAAATLSHPATYPALPGGEWRMASYPNPRLDWLSVDALRNRLMPSSSDLLNAAAVTGAPPEITRLTTGIYKDKYECKYDYSADFGAIDTWGWSSTTDKVGLWITAPSKEYYPGGPMKRELTGHVNPVLLNMLGGTHYEQGSETSVAAGEEWQKNYGPFLIYCNKVDAGTANAPIALWENAKTQAKTEQAAWPYSWHNNPSYVKQSGRGTVTGKLVINDSGNASASAADTWVGLGIPPTGSSSSTDFEDWSKNYQFWVKTDANGNFSIPDVLPGTYSLFAFGPGANGQLSLSNYATVTAGSTTALGNVNWTPTRVAKTVWEIGKSDRNAMEFKHGNDWWTSNTYPDARWGIFMNYPDEFPNGVNFTIGQSNIATDWNFVHPYNKTIHSESPKWNVNFNLDSAPVTGSSASVYVALAANFSSALILTVNGTNVTVPATGFAPSNNSNAMIRKGIHGAFADTRFTFPASYLKAGANQITFTLRVTGSATSGEVMYDYIRLEADIPVCLKPTFTSSPTNTNGTTAANSCDAVVNYNAVASENPTYSYIFTGATTGSGTGTGSGSKFNKGTTQVAITATNSCENAIHSFDIIISDSTKPTIIAPQNIQISTTNSDPVTGVQLGTPTVDDNCSATNNLTVSNDAPSSFSQGTTAVIWTVTDESGNSQTATQQVIITMNTAPTAVLDQISLSEGATSSALVGGATSVLTNDTDAENNVLTATLVSNVTNGTLTFNGNGTFSYVHNGSETTTDSFSYKVNDGTLDSNIVTVSIAVTPVNDTPVAVADAITVTEGGTANGTTVLANDSDAENNTLTATLVSNVTNGILTLNSNGTFSYIHNGSETTSDSFTYKANDGSSNSNVVTVSITVTPVNDAPIALADAVSVANGGTAAALVGNGTSVLANDTDAENNVLTAILVSNVTNGSLTLNSNGTFSYVHNGSNTTSDSFSYKANDGTSNSNVVTVNIAIAQFTLANNNFTIESKSETCANKNNGQIIINALNSYNYVAKINGTNYPLVNNSLTVSNLTPGTYSVCITITGKSFEQCYTAVIAQGGTISAKSTISSDKVAVEITEGTAPFEVLVNGVSQFETAASSFTVDVKQGDLLQVKTAKACEGIYAKNIVGMGGNVSVYPNPTHGWVEITVPTTKKEAIIELYTVAGQLISSGNFTIVNQKVQLNLDKVARGAYLAKVYLETPVSVKIIKY